jgi:hypothetical protein
LHLATLLLFCCASFNFDTPRLAGDQPVVPAHHSEEATPVQPAAPALPNAPVAKAEAPADSDASTAVPVEAILPAGGALLNSPVKPAAHGSYETTRQRKIWYGLVAAGHSAAGFDAYTTRRAISGGYGVESNPIMRPFAQSNAIYFATQVTPAVMDYVGHRMMTSNHSWMRRMWWVPQLAGTSLSLGAGIHNYKMVP